MCRDCISLAVIFKVDFTDHSVTLASEISGYDYLKNNIDSKLRFVVLIIPALEIADTIWEFKTKAEMEIQND